MLQPLQSLCRVQAFGVGSVQLEAAVRPPNPGARAPCGEAAMLAMGAQRRVCRAQPSASLPPLPRLLDLRSHLLFPRTPQPLAPWPLQVLSAPVPLPMGCSWTRLRAQSCQVERNWLGSLQARPRRTALEGAIPHCSPGGHAGIRRPGKLVAWGLGDTVRVKVAADLAAPPLRKEV